MKISWKNKMGMGLCCVIAAGVLAGCGSNLFGDESDSSSLDSEFANASTNQEKVQVLDSALANATTIAEYQQIVAKANEILLQEDVSDADKVGAFVVKGESQLGASGVEALDIVNQLSTVVDAAPGDVSNIFNALDFGDEATIDNLITAANAFNLANEIAQASQSSSRLSVQEVNLSLYLTETQQLSRFISNAIVALKILETTFVINNDGSLSAKNPSQSIYENISALLNPLLANDEVAEGIDYYAYQALNALEDAGSFTESQKEDLEALKNAGLVTYHIYVAASLDGNIGGQSIIYRLKDGDTTRAGGITYTFTSLSTGERDTLLETALNQAYKDIVAFPNTTLEIQLNEFIIDPDAYLEE